MVDIRVPSWRRRTDTRTDDMAHGITFRMWETSVRNVRGEAALGETKYHLEGAGSLTLAEGQWKYGDELIAQCYGPATELRVKERRASRHIRIQVYLGQATLETAMVLREIANRIEERAAERKKEAA